MIEKENEESVDMILLQQSQEKIKETLPKIEPRSKYNSDVREKIDNVNKRKKFKEETFGEHKTIKDSYSGEIIHSTHPQEVVKKKYGQKNYTKHTSQVDHTVPLEEVYRRNQYNPFLEMEDIKAIGNVKGNYNVTSGRVNTSKGKQSNIEYVRKHSDSMNVQQKAAMITKQVEGEVAVGIETAKRTAKGALKAGKPAAIEAAKIGGAVSAAQNISQVISGEEDIDEAVITVAIDTVKASATAHATAVATQEMNAIANKLADKGSQQLAKQLTNFTNAGGIGTAIVVVKEAGGTLIKYINGEISGDECIYELGEKGTGMAMSLAGGTEGALIGSALGGIIGSVVPVVGNVVGAEIGAVVGNIVGNIVGYMVGTELYNKVAHLMTGGVDAEQVRRATIMYEKLAENIRMQRLELEKSLQYVHEQSRKAIFEGFENMRTAIMQNDIELAVDSLETICMEFGVDVAYKTRNEFDDFMEKDELIVQL